MKNKCVVEIKGITHVISCNTLMCTIDYKTKTIHLNKNINNYTKTTSKHLKEELEHIITKWIPVKKILQKILDTHMSTNVGDWIISLIID